MLGSRRVLDNVSCRWDTYCRRKEAQMRRGIALLVAGVLLGAMVMWVLPAGAHHKQSVKALKKRVTKLENQLESLDEFIFRCLLVRGMTSFGDTEENTFGYRWEDGTETFLTSALDFDDSGDPEAWNVVADPSCVAPGGAPQNHELSPQEVGADKAVRR
jgi:hypothetical protein